MIEGPCIPIQPDLVYTCLISAHTPSLNPPSLYESRRELESLERSKVYAHSVLRIQLPDRTIVMAKFHPRETIADVRTLLTEQVFSEVCGQGRKEGGGGEMERGGGRLREETQRGCGRFCVCVCEVSMCVFFCVCLIDWLGVCMCVGG